MKLGGVSCYGILHFSKTHGTAGGRRLRRNAVQEGASRSPAIELVLDAFHEIGRGAHWNARLAALREDGRRAALWGSGSKAVAFLTALEVGEAIECVVDINPRKQGMYMAGTRQRIVPPAFLTDDRPDVVIVMNPVYSDEIRSELLSLGLEPELLSL